MNSELTAIFRSAVTVFLLIDIVLKMRQTLAKFLGFAVTLSVLGFLSATADGNLDQQGAFLIVALFCVARLLFFMPKDKTKTVFGSFWIRAIVNGVGIALLWHPAPAVSFLIHAFWPKPA